MSQFDYVSVVKQANATSASIGILQNKPKTGQPCEIYSEGVSKVWASGTVAIMDHLAPCADACNDSGVLVVTTTDNDEYVAIALAVHTGDTKSLIPAIV